MGRRVNGKKIVAFVETDDFDRHLHTARIRARAYVVFVLTTGPAGSVLIFPRVQPPRVRVQIHTVRRTVYTYIYLPRSIV